MQRAKAKEGWIWSLWLNLRNVSNRKHLVSGSDSNVRRETGCKNHHKWFSAHWERKRWLSGFIHNLLRCVIRSWQTPTPKSLRNTSPRNICSRFDAHTNNNISEEEWCCLRETDFGFTTNTSYIWLFRSNKCASGYCMIKFWGDQPKATCALFSSIQPNFIQWALNASIISI